MKILSAYFRETLEVQEKKTDVKIMFNHLQTIVGLAKSDKFILFGVFQGHFIKIEPQNKELQILFIIF